MKLINQPFNGQLGNNLIELLDSSEYDSLNIAVAFAKSSGVLRLKDSFDRFRERGGIINVNVGVDLGVTSYEALTALLLCTDSLNVVHTEKSQTFHSKIYQFLGKEKGVIIIGSNNLTGGGLWTNFESSVYVSLNLSNDKDIDTSKSQDDYFKTLTSLGKSFRPISTKDDIDMLLHKGYISKEVSQRVRSVKDAPHKEGTERLFGNGVSATLPSIAAAKKEVTAASSNIPTKTEPELQEELSETIWLETRRLTGGSRNILDLSMKSLVEKGNPQGTPFDLGEPGFMRGGVEFFGINPSTTDERKDITINFEGVDYTQNTILFPSGNNANGTWRLQIKGVSSSEEKITDAFRTKGEEHYLVMKIVTFTKIEDDYYSMAVFPESELENFQIASRILARNGSTKNAKQLGLL